MKDINSICHFFENMNEYVYVMDIETYEMIYMNRKTLEAYGLKSLDEIKGRKCYELLQKSAIPCGMCIMIKSAKDSLKNGVIIIRL